MMDITPLVAADRQIVHGYGDGGFTISGVRHNGSVLLWPDATVAWAVESVDHISFETLMPLTSLTPPPAILLVGCGPRMSILPRTLRAQLRQLGIVAEPMETGAACRTYNVLLTEGRSVAAALIAV